MKFLGIFCIGFGWIECFIRMFMGLEIRAPKPPEVNANTID